ncbi:MAG: tol-pal system protein YbgF [Rhodocyclaceae bacterium]|nr:tol-pal system protein YbgF [Rhodocyclaceae bacterium]
MRPLALLFCLALLLPGRSWAGLFDDEEARRQIKELRAELTQTIDALRSRIDALAKNQLDFANQGETLRAEVARLVGQVEVLTNALEAVHKRQRDFYVDLDARLRKLEAPPAAAAPPEAPAPAAEPKADPQAEMRAYEAALGLFRESRFKEAQAAFEAFIAAYPKTTLAPNAHYWLGSSLYQQKRYDASAAAFGRVATQWPNDPKAPEAWLAQANALIGAQDVKAAIKALETLIDKYPAHPAAETARARLKTLAPKKK